MYIENKEVIENLYENIITEYITIVASSSYYINFFKKMNIEVKKGEIINLPIEKLPKNSNKKILVKCTECSKVINISFNNYVSIMKKGHNYKCSKCNTFKKNMLRIYNVDNSMKINKFVNKILETKKEKYNDFTYNNRIKNKETILNKYNVDHYSKTDEFKEKYKNTCNLKYNTDNVSQIQEIKEKKKITLKNNYNVNSLLSLKSTQIKKLETVRKKYNVDNVFQLDSVKEKSKKTMLKKYGVETPGLLKNKRYKIKFDDRFNLYYQGTYEKDFLDLCYDKKIEILKPKYIKYILDDKEYKYFPDYYYKPLNLIIEIKSDYIFELQKEENIKKQEECLKNGYNYIFIINKNYEDFLKMIL